MKSLPVPAAQPCSPALSHQKVPNRPTPRRSLHGVQLVLLLLAAGLVTGCRATNHVARLSQPNTVSMPHQVQHLDAAFVADDGRLFLRTGGLLAGEPRPTTLTVVLPPATEGTGTVAQRVVVPPTAVRVGWALETQATSPLKPMPVGPPLVLTARSTYEWDWLRPTAGRGREVRLVRRLGAVERWEVLHMSVNASSGECRYTVFEVRPKQVVVNHRTALLLLPLAMASDVVAVGTMTAAPIAVVISAPFGGLAGLAGLAHLGDLEPVKHLRGAW